LWQNRVCKGSPVSDSLYRTAKDIQTSTQNVHRKKAWKERDQETQGLNDASVFQQHKTNLEMKSSTGSSIFQTVVRQPRTQARQTTRL
jgi:hypothetical protein